MAAVAKSERTTSKRFFTIANKEFKKLMNQNAFQSILQKRFEEVSQAWSSVMSKHAAYLALAYPEDDEIPDEEETWLDEIALEYSKSEQALASLLQQDSTNVKTDTSPSNEIKQAAKASKFERLQLEMSIDNMKRVVEHKGSAIEVIIERNSVENEKGIERVKE